MTTDLTYLALTALLTGLLWLPYIVNVGLKTGHDVGAKTSQYRLI